MISTSLLIASLPVFTLVFGTPTAYNLKLHESRTDIPAGFSLTGPAPPDAPLQLRIALVQNNFTALEEALYDVSTPSSANYGKYLSKKEVKQLLNSGSYSRGSVLEWVDTANTAKQYVDAKGVALLDSWLTIEVPVREANEWLNADFSVFTHNESGLQAIRTLSYSIPAELEDHLDLVHPTISVTSVGATQGLHPETVTGGFSNVFPQPRYQAHVVPAYPSVLGDTHAGAFNPLGRAVPDVPAHGADRALVVDGQTMRVDDARATFAAVIALLNDRLVAAGRSLLGFLNPFLYSAAGAAAFTDITAGSNPRCGTSGFPAQVGWDPVTGLSTPNFAKLLATVGL